jgi:predicted DsbA family dithiol-disulfide isomerase
VRLRRLSRELEGRLVVEWRAFPLRPAPDPAVTWKGTYREDAWSRCQALAGADATFTPWRGRQYPNWSLPALEAAKCVLRQGADAFERLHLRLYEAFFTHGRNIADRAVVVEVVRESGVDLDRFRADYDRGDARQDVLRDLERAVTEHGVRAIPTVVIGERRLTGMMPLASYRQAIEERALT